MNVFLSYSHEDSDLVRTNLDKIKAAIGNSDDILIVDTQSLDGNGDNFRAMIKSAINASSEFAVFATPNSAKSQWVNYEVGLADALGKEVIIVGHKGSGKSALSRFHAENARTVLID